MNVKERFLKYVSFPTMSDGESKTCPSSKKQLALAQYLKSELENIGMENTEVDENGYVYGFLKANTDKKCDRIGFIAHMDTSSAASDTDIKAREVLYGGGDILLNKEKGYYLSASEYPYLESFKGQHLIVTDGTTLLGADDKAGLAEIVCAVDKLIKSGKEHGDIAVCFTPDEEIGRGADRFDIKKFGCDYAYTVDGGFTHELEFENFNAGGANIEIHGISIHPGSAKNKMKNAALIACEFNSMLPENEVPEKTEGYEGFHFLSGITGGTELASLSYIIRDHDKALFEKKKEDFIRIAEALNKKYGEGTVDLKLHDSYYNMKKIIEKHMYTVERMSRAMKLEGVTPEYVPVRGGTDGARLSFMGLPCPNIGTGGANFHSRFEFVSVEAMEKVSDIILRVTTELLSECR